MQTKKWAYQFRERDRPWAICAILTYPRGNPEKARLAFDIYSERIDNEAHLLRIDEQRYDDLGLARNMVMNLISCFDDLTCEDVKQIDRFVNTILEV